MLKMERETCKLTIRSYVISYLVPEVNRNYKQIIHSSTLHVASANNVTCLTAGDYSYMSI